MSCCAHYSQITGVTTRMFFCLHSLCSQRRLEAGSGVYLDVSSFEVTTFDADCGYTVGRKGEGATRDQAVTIQTEVNRRAFMRDGGGLNDNNRSHKVRALAKGRVP